MDERTLKDDTIMLARWEFWSERIDPKSEDDSDEAFRDIEDWATVRVDIRNAAEAVAGIGDELEVHTFAMYLSDEDDGVCLRGPR